jgi:hypothetical protein
MSHVKLCFNLPEEEEEFRQAIDGWKYQSILYTVDQWLRSLHKHQDIEKVDVTEVRDMIHSEAMERGVEI